MDEKPKFFYIQCVGRYAHDFILWWKPNHRGYTYNLDKAGLYTEEQARSIVEDGDGEDVPWPSELVLQNTQIAVSIEDLRIAHMCLEALDDSR